MAKASSVLQRQSASLEIGAPRKFGMGQPVRRVEDARFITGQGYYATDYLPEGGVLTAVVLRSPHARAKFAINNLSAVRAMSGVRLVLTGADVKGLTLPCPGTVKQSGDKAMSVPPYYLLCIDEVRHVGDALAFVVADSLEQARDALDAFDIDWQAEEAVADIDAALVVDAPLVWPKRKGNIAYETEQGDKSATDTAFKKAAKIVTMDISNNRLVSNYMEPRSVVAEYNQQAGTFKITLSSQGSHGLRDSLAKHFLNIAPEKVRVITPDVGGGFGPKGFMFREYPLAAIAAQKLGAAVQWVSDRAEHFLACCHGRDNLATAEMALDAQGHFLAMRVDLRANMGAYLSQYAPFIPWIGVTMTTGCYRIPAAYIRIRGVYTHTVPVDAYRGAGRPEAAYLVERLVDEIARQTGETPDSIRAKNFIRSDEMPYKTPTGRNYDSGDFEGHMKAAMAALNWQGFPQRYQAALQKGLVRGIGLGSYIEACGGGGAEPAYVSLQPDGMVIVKIGSQSNGQGHETAYAQLVSQHLDLPLSRIRVLQGDTNDTPTGSGTGGSRSIPVGGAAVAGAAHNLAHNLKAIAANILEAAEEDLELREGMVIIQGTDRMISLEALAKHPKTDLALLSTTDAFRPPEATYPNGTHAVEVEIERATGRLSFINYVIVDDFGVTLNPLMLEGQVQGGAAQGIGQALMEQTVFTKEGQLLTATFMDYAMPRAKDIPSFSFTTRNVLCKTNAIGVKGAGEAGSIGACPAVMNAICDALYRATGKAAMDMPATSEKLWRALR